MMINWAITSLLDLGMRKRAARFVENISADHFFACRARYKRIREPITSIIQSLCGHYKGCHDFDRRRPLGETMKRWRPDAEWRGRSRERLSAEGTSIASRRKKQIQFLLGWETNERTIPTISAQLSKTHRVRSMEIHGRLDTGLI